MWTSRLLPNDVPITFRMSGKYFRPSRKDAYIVLIPIKPHFYIVKLGLEGYTLFFLLLLKNIDCGYSLEPPRRRGSNEYPQYVLSKNVKNIRIFYLKNFIFGGKVFSIFE